MNMILLQRYTKKTISTPVGISAPVTDTTAPKTKVKKTKVSKKQLPHVLICVSHNGLGQSRTWSKTKLNIIGVYGSKEDADRKRGQMMHDYEKKGQVYGNGDICVGDSWSDEFDFCTL
jgi:hypothetical protein